MTDSQWWPSSGFSTKDLVSNGAGCFVAAVGLLLWEQRSKKELRYVDLELGLVVRRLI